MSVGRVTARSKIYEIKIELREVRPAVVRRVQVPGEVSLAGLHAVVHAAMVWTDSHLHEFEIAGAATDCQTRTGTTARSAMRPR